MSKYFRFGSGMMGLVLAGCVSGSAGHYTPLASADKNEIQQLKDNIYRVEYQVSPATSQEQLDDYLRRRCAELTVREGYDVFRLTQRADVLGFSRRTSVTVTMYKGSLPAEATDLIDAKVLLQIPLPSQSGDK
jgi:ATP-dependent protease HslVU (ClpYQ) peptidase subunit